jgi:hypothetical protein
MILFISVRCGAVVQGVLLMVNLLLLLLLSQISGCAARRPRGG